MTIRYHHMQRGTLTLAVMLVAVIVSASAAYLNPSSGRWFLWAIAGGCVVLAWLFSSLTVEIDERDLRWYFGPGIWKYRMSLADIDNVQIVRNQWSNGFGIRMRPGFRLYNVSGLDAVELRLKTGDIRRIGTNGAQRLAIVLKS